MSDASRPRYTILRGLVLVALTLLGGWAGLAAADNCVVAWWQGLSEIVIAAFSVVACGAGCAIGIALGFALWGLLQPVQSSAATGHGARIVLRVAMVILLFGAYGAILWTAFQGFAWQEFAPEGGGFRVLLPGRPVEQEEMESTPQGMAKGKRFLAQNRRTGERFQAYAVAYLDYPAGYIESHTPEELFRSQQASLAPTGGLSRPRTLDGFPGHEVQVETDDGRLVILRMYLVRERLFLLFARHARSQQPTEVETFFGAFALTGR